MISFGLMVFKYCLVERLNLENIDVHNFKRLCYSLIGRWILSIRMYLYRYITAAYAAGCAYLLYFLIFSLFQYVVD